MHGVLRRVLGGLVAVAVSGSVLVGAAPGAGAAPAAPSLTSPAYNAQVSSNPVLTWAAVPGAVRYRVQVSTSSSFSSLLYAADTYGLNATPPADLPLAPIYWRVAGIDAANAVGPFGTSQFVRNAAAAPVLQSPVDGSPLSYPTQSPVLAWNPVEGVKSYEVELDDANDFIGAQKFTTANTSLALTEPLTLNKDWYWHVRGVSTTPGVTTSYSAAWSFNISWSTGVPQLVSPADGATVTDVVLRWNPVAGAKAYQVQVSPNPEFTNNVVDDTVAKGTQYSRPATYANAGYYWRVRAIDTGATSHQSNWSAPWQFTRSWTLPDGTDEHHRPVPQYPLGGQTIDEPRFQWTGVDHASYYVLEVSADSTFPTASTTTCKTYHTRVTAEISGNYTQKPHGFGACTMKPAAGQLYYWRVRGMDELASGTPAIIGIDSPVESFVFHADVPTLVSPANGAQVDVPTLRWEALQGAQKYHVVVHRVDTGAQVAAVDTYATSYTPIAALSAPAGTTFSWGVSSVDAEGTPGAVPLLSQEWRFSIANPLTTSTTFDPTTTPSSTPQLMPALTWTPYTNATGYNIYVRRVGEVTWVQQNSAKLPYAGWTGGYLPGPVGLKGPGDYEWFVEAYNSTGTLLDWSPNGTFSISDFAALDYLAPKDCRSLCADTLPDVPQLAWSAVPGAAFYKIKIALDQDFTNVVANYQTHNTTLTPREAYLDNSTETSYFWFVQSCTIDSRCSLADFDTQRTQAHAFRKQSESVQLTSPADTATVGDAVAFSWKDYFLPHPDTNLSDGRTPALGDNIGAKAYRIQVATDDRFNNVIDTATVDQTSYEAFASAYVDGVYYWRVQALDGAGSGLTWSSTRSFTKSGSLPSSLSTSSVGGGLPTLRWAAQPFASQYLVEVYRGTDPAYPPANLALSQTTRFPAFTPTSPLPAGDYSWRVKKLNPDGLSGAWAGAAGTTKFTVSATAPTLLSPAAGATLRTNALVFDWSAVAGAAQYQFESSSSASFSTVVERQNTVMTTWATANSYADSATPYYWRVRVLDGNGNVLATTATRSFYKDATAPTVKLTSATANFPFTGSFTVSFSETVKNVSPSGLKVRVAGTTSYVVGTTTPASTSQTTTATWTPSSPLVPGQKYELVVGSGITDVAGNPLAAYTSPVVRTALVADSGSPVIRQVWDVDSTSSASGGSYSVSAVAGGMATFSFTGTQVSLIGVRGAGGGYADVYLDGVKKATPNFYSASTAWKQTVWSISGLTNAKHTVQVKALGTKYSSSKGTEVYIDAFDVSGARTEGTSSLVTYTFRKVSTTGALGNSYDMERYVSDAGGRPEWQMTFRGTGVDWYATKLPSAGQAYVYIDNVYKATINLYAASATYKAKVYYSPTLTDAVHTIRIVSKGTKGTSSATATDVTMDYFAVR